MYDDVTYICSVTHGGTAAGGLTVHIPHELDGASAGALAPRAGCVPLH